MTTVSILSVISALIVSPYLLSVSQCLSVSLSISLCACLFSPLHRTSSPSPNFLPFRYSLEQWSPDGNWSADKYDRIFFDAEISPLGQHCTGALMRIHHIFMIYLAGGNSFLALTNNVICSLLSPFFLPSS